MECLPPPAGTTAAVAEIITYLCIDDDIYRRLRDQIRHDDSRLHHRIHHDVKRHVFFIATVTDGRVFVDDEVRGIFR